MEIWVWQLFLKLGFLAAMILLLAGSVKIWKWWKVRRAASKKRATPDRMPARALEQVQIACVRICLYGDSYHTDEKCSSVTNSTTKKKHIACGNGSRNHTFALISPTAGPGDPHGD